MKATTRYAAVPQSVAEDIHTYAPGAPKGIQAGHSGDEEEGAGVEGRASVWYERAKRALYLSSLTMLTLVMGFCLGRNHDHLAMGGGGGGHSSQAAASMTGGKTAANGGLLPPQAFLPDIPMREVSFDFPTPYEETTVEGDKLWDALMPIGSGFVRVPYPRRFDMPASKAIDDDPEEAEIYSLSMLHQLHCLGVIRDVIKKYEKNEPSRFAGAGHEYHCIDYLRQAIMCSGDTTLDYAEMHDDGTRRGFSGANSTHQCRDWDTIVGWAVENRAGDKKGIA